MRVLAGLGLPERNRLGQTLLLLLQPSTRFSISPTPGRLAFTPIANLRSARHNSQSTFRESFRFISSYRPHGSARSPRRTLSSPRRTVWSDQASYTTNNSHKSTSTSSRWSLALVLSVGSLAAAVTATLHYAQARNGDSAPSSPVHIERIEMAAEMPPGRPGNLTPEQEEKLRQLWAAIFQVCGVNEEDSESAENPNPSTVAEKGSQKSDLGKPEKPKKKRLGMFSRKSNKEAGAESVKSTPTSIITPKEGEDDKYGQTKHFFDTLASQSPETIRATIWSMVKHDHPDALVLRFLRARKWDVEKALVMLVSTMSWRAKEMHVDDDIMKNGEGAAVEAEKSGDGDAKKLGHDFMAQIRMGKSFLHGVDKNGRPICVVRVRLHHQGEQCEESLERYTVYIIETARMLLRPPVDTATIIFDMTGFSMANMDYTPVKFMIKCFEANYPESLGSVLVHKAPWIFQGIWKIIRGWLDPVVASKVHFTNNMKDMEEFIAPDRIIKELEGQENWEYSYVEPVAGENDKMKDTETRDRLLTARETTVKEFEEATLQWIRNPASEKTAAIKAQREAAASQLRDGYWTLDPYLRARSLYDRIGVIRGGSVVPYPEQTATSVNGAPGVVSTTSADDVD